MSSISSAGGGQGPYQFLQSIAATGQSQAPASTSATTATTATGATAATDPTNTPSSSSSTPVSGGHHHHHHGGSGGADLFKQVQDAVSSALQSAQQNGAADPTKTIEDAITKVLQNAGNSSATTGGIPAAGSDTDGDAASAPASTTTSSKASATDPVQSFLQTLQSYGVNPNQFRSDFLSAIKDAQNGTVNASTAFQSFPTGSLIDVAG